MCKDLDIPQAHRTLPFYIEGWQGGTPATGAALAGRSCPHTCMFWDTLRPGTCECGPPILATHLCHVHHSPRPSLYPPRPWAIYAHACTTHLRSHPLPPSVHIGTPRTHAPCTICIHAPTICTCSIHTIHMCTIHIHMSMPHRQPRLCATDNLGVQLHLGTVGRELWWRFLERGLTQGKSVWMVWMVRKLMGPRTIEPLHVLVFLGENT